MNCSQIAEKMQYTMQQQSALKSPARIDRTKKVVNNFTYLIYKYYTPTCFSPRITLIG